MRVQSPSIPVRNQSQAEENLALAPSLLCAAALPETHLSLVGRALHSLSAA